MTLNKRTSPEQTPNTGAKNILARLMASENILVEHSAAAQTASFNTKSRVLTLPVWESMDDALYDMLVGHEVSHALYTPVEGWERELDRFGAINRGMWMTFVNIVEDARIERMIKAKFPGLRRDFFAAYKNLAERDLFQIGDRDLSELPLIDRLNLEFKIGTFISVPFSADESKWIDALSGTKTFEDVCEVAADLFEMQKEDEDENTEDGDDTPETGEGGEQDMPSGEQEQDGPQGNGSIPSPSEEEGEEGESGSGSSESDAGEGDDTDETTSGSAKGDGTMDGEDSEDDGSTAESKQTSGNGESEGSIDDDSPNDSYENNSKQNAGGTQNAMDRALSNMIDEGAHERQYVDAPKAILDNVIVDHADIASDIERFVSERPERTTAMAAASIEMQQFERESRKTINMMAQQFQRRQSADILERTSVSQTGVLDVNKMHTYKWNEDMFLRAEEVAEGKNHGLVLFVDWSGSMCNIMEDTIRQMIQMVLFCKKVGIPFEVYSFTSNLRTKSTSYYNMTDEEREEMYNIKSFEGEANVHCQGQFCLNNYLSSRMNARQMKQGLVNMMYLAKGMNYYNSGFELPYAHNLGSTPLNEALLASMDIIPAFQRANNVQIVNTLVLTDGEASGRIGGYGRVTVLRDPKTKEVCEIDGRYNCTPAILELAKKRTGAKFVGIYLNESKSLRGYYEDKQTAEYKKNGFTSTDKAGYTEYFIVKADKKVENAGLEDLKDDASYTKIKNTFMKQSSSRVNSRILLNRVIDLIAS